MIHFSIGSTLARCVKQGGKPELTLPEPWPRLSRGWIKRRTLKSYLTLAALIDWILDGMTDLNKSGNEMPLLTFDRITEQSPGLRLFEAHLKFRWGDKAIPKHKPEELFGLLAFGLDNQSEYTAGNFEMRPLVALDTFSLDPLETVDGPRFRRNTLLAIEAVTCGYMFQNLERFSRIRQSERGSKGGFGRHIKTKEIKNKVLRFREQRHLQGVNVPRLVREFVEAGHEIAPFPDQAHLVRAVRPEFKRHRQALQNG